MVDVYVLDSSFSIIGVIDTYSSLIWTDRYDEAGDFELVVPADSNVLSLLAIGNYLEKQDSEHVMIIEGIETVTDPDDFNKFIFTGRSLESILERRIIWPQTNLSGNLQTGVISLITSNIINPADSSRAIPRFQTISSTDEAVTNLTLTAQYTGDNLYDAVTDICKVFGIGFKITLSGGKFTFQLYSGVDRSYDQTENPYVVFSPEFDNIISSDFVESFKEYKNVSYIAGEGEGTDRISTTTGTATGIDRRELFVDARDLSRTTDSGEMTIQEYTNKLKERGDENLAEYKTLRVFDSEIDYRTNFIFNEDYFIGDIVQVVNEYGLSAKYKICEIIENYDENGHNIYPSFAIIDA